MTAPSAVHVARDWARYYVSAGIVPIPLLYRSKIPASSAWQSTTLAAAAASLDRDFPPGANVGVVLGAPSGDLVDVDLDCPEAVALSHAYLPPTMVAGRTSMRSSHRFYRAKGARTAKFVDPRASADATHKTLIEIRSTGAQTMVAPSVHPSGETVEWETLSPLTEIDHENLLWRVSVIAAAALLGRHWPGGGRHESQLALAGALLDAGWTDEDAATFLRAVCFLAGDEDAAKREQSVASSRARLDAGESVTGWGKLSEHVGGDIVATAKKWLGIQARDFRRGDHPELAHALLDALREKGPVVGDEGRLYRYDPARHLFLVVPDHEQVREVSRFAGRRVGPKKHALKLKRPDLLGTARTALDLATEPDFFADAPTGVMFADAFVKVTAEGITTETPGPEHRARYAYDFAYTPDVLPDRFLAFLSSTFAGDNDAFWKIALEQEYFGISLLGRAAKFQKALVLLGDGSNGKGVTLKVVEACFPPRSTIAIPPQEWSNEYRRAMMAGKLLNLLNELPDREMISSEAFKGIVAGDPMTGRHIREAPFTFVPVAGHVFGANPPLPATADQTHAFWRRWLILEHNRIVVDDAQNVNLADEIIAAERPAIVGWLLAGAHRALARGQLTVPPSSDRAVEAWKGYADQVLAFVNERCVRLNVGEADLGKPDRGHLGGTKATPLYEAYKMWALESGHLRMAKNKFGMRMRLIGLPSVGKTDGGYYPVYLKPR